MLCEYLPRTAKLLYILNIMDDEFAPLHVAMYFVMVSTAAIVILYHSAASPSNSIVMYTVLK